MKWMTGFFNIHSDVIKWKHFPRYWLFVRGIHRSPVNSPDKGQWRGALMFSMICVWINNIGKQSWGWWFETPSHPLWRHCNVDRIQWTQRYNEVVITLKDVALTLLLSVLRYWRFHAIWDIVSLALVIAADNGTQHISSTFTEVLKIISMCEKLWTFKFEVWFSSEIDWTNVLKNNKKQLI